MNKKPDYGHRHDDKRSSKIKEWSSEGAEDYASLLAEASRELWS